MLRTRQSCLPDRTSSPAISSRERGDELVAVCASIQMHIYHGIFIVRLDLANGACTNVQRLFVTDAVCGVWMDSRYERYLRLQVLPKQEPLSTGHTCCKYF